MFLSYMFISPKMWSQGAEAPIFPQDVAARLKPCPSTTLANLFVMLSGERAERNARLVRSRSIPTRASLFHPGIPPRGRIQPMRIAADDEGDFLGARPSLELFLTG